ncbi:response regulator [Microvirga antarctica]|uniref:response regulator n=1 Tax=Microvirga antarctica TaxID=2819233 RepID=UPI001B317F57|nr:response regulator [Microvirga antarctica]
MVQSAPHMVLVVEDELLLRINAVDMLEDEGFAVLEASSADEALTLLAECCDDVAVLFTDINMPGALDGLALARIVHERWPHIWPLVTSGGTTLRDDQVPDHGKFLHKPYRATQLTSAVRDVLSRH